MCRYWQEERGQLEPGRLQKNPVLSGPHGPALGPEGLRSAPCRGDGAQGPPHPFWSGVWGFCGAALGSSLHLQPRGGHPRCSSHSPMGFPVTSSAGAPVGASAAPRPCATCRVGRARGARASLRAPCPCSCSGGRGGRDSGGPAPRLLGRSGPPQEGRAGPGGGGEARALARVSGARSQDGKFPCGARGLGLELPGPGQPLPHAAASQGSAPPRVPVPWGRGRWHGHPRCRGSQGGMRRARGPGRAGAAPRERQR